MYENIPKISHFSLCIFEKYNEIVSQCSTFMNYLLPIYTSLLFITNIYAC